MQSLQGGKSMRYPGNTQLVMVLSFCFVIAGAGLFTPASAAIIEAAVNVHLRVVNRCAMSLSSSALNPRVDVHCSRPVAYEIKIHQQPPSSVSEANYGRVVISY